jgi:hypothetical protein
MANTVALYIGLLSIICILGLVWYLMSIQQAKSQETYCGDCGGMRSSHKQFRDISGNVVKSQAPRTNILMPYDRFEAGF